VEFDILGWPEDGPTLDLDHERFAYAGKFVMTRTGKAVARDDGAVVGAVAFDPDRTDETVARLRYVTVRADRRGEGIGPRLLVFTRDALADRGHESVRIAVNNPFAYDACYRAGFAFTGEETGLAELVLAWPVDGETPAYRSGLSHFARRDLPDAAAAHVAAARERGPPDRVSIDA
jgi:predicted N-acetyltransferase YhbS